MRTGTKKYLKLVRQEIDYIKENATEEEKSRLHIGTLDPSSPDRCIYGQMTRSCWSKRADSLIDGLPINFFVEDIQARIADEGDIARGTLMNFTLLEHFIYNYPQNNSNILSYLKGEAEELELKVK